MLIPIEEMLAGKVEVSSGMEPAYEAYRAKLQAELANAESKSS